MSHAVSTASPALHKAKRTALQRFRSPERLAAIVAATVPATTGHRACDPRAIRTPADTPAAGQKTATPSGLVKRARLSRAATKYNDANRDSEPNRATPPREVDAGGQLRMNLYLQILPHLVVPSWACLPQDPRDRRYFCEWQPISRSAMFAANLPRSLRDQANDE